MDLPEKLLEELVAETEIYFFNGGTPIGVPDHYHICVKRKERLILFTACASQINTIFTFLSHTSTDPNTIPCIHPNPTNCFGELTFVDCNRVFDYDVQAFLGDIRKGTVRKENGHLSLEEMRLLIRGIKLSKTVADSIKKLFE